MTDGRHERWTELFSAKVVILCRMTDRGTQKNGFFSYLLSTIFPCQQKAKHLITGAVALFLALYPHKQEEEETNGDNHEMGHKLSADNG